MDIQLPSGYQVTLRDTFLRGDRRAALRALKLHVNPDNSRDMDGSLADNVAGALLRQMIISWTVPQPLPSAVAGDDQAQAVLDQLGADDYEALADAVRPWLDKVLPGSGGGETPATCPHCGKPLREAGEAGEGPNSPSGGSGTSTSAAQAGQQTLTT